METELGQKVVHINEDVYLWEKWQPENEIHTDSKHKSLKAVSLWRVQGALRYKIWFEEQRVFLRSYLQSEFILNVVFAQA